MSRVRGSQVRKDVAEQIGGDHHVEAVGVLDKVGGEDVVATKPPSCPCSNA